MRQFNEYLAAATRIVALALMLFIGYLLQQLQTGLTGVGSSLSSIGTDVHAIVLPTQKMEATWAAAGLTAAQTLSKERDAFAAQQQSYLTLTEKTAAVLDSANVAVKHLDESAQTIGTLAPELRDQIARIGEDTHATLLAGQETLRQATSDLADPEIKQAVSDIAKSAANLADATKQAEGALEDVHSATSYELAQLKKPITKIQAIYGFALTAIRKLFF